MPKNGLNDLQFEHNMYHGGFNQFNKNRQNLSKKVDFCQFWLKKAPSTHTRTQNDQNAKYQKIWIQICGEYHKEHLYKKQANWAIFLQMHKLFAENGF